MIEPDAIRSCFPALAGPTILLENAGGSQVPCVVADAIRDYMLESYAQLGAGYPASDRATATVAEAHAWMERLVGGAGRGAAILGASCTQLVFMLADCHARALRPGDRIVVAANGHEANVGPWLALAKRGLDVVLWPIDPETGRCRLADLEPLLNDRVRLVACLHVSNLLGEIEDVRSVADRVHAAGARIVVDGVAFAPHRAIDVAALDVDWYVFSTYKVYGPHMGALWGRREAIDELEGPNHFFIPRSAGAYKFELGGCSHEGSAALLALRDYLCTVAALDGRPTPAPAAIDRATIERAFAAMTELERPLQERLLAYLDAAPQWRIVGPFEASVDRRVPTISFVHASRPSAEIAAAVNARGFGIRHGHMYSHRLCAALGLPVDDGVVRVSAVHYNTTEEIDRLIEVLDAL